MTNKKKILFILGVLDSGGVAKSLVSLLNAIDRQQNDVSLLLVSSHKGPFFELLPKDVRIIQSPLLSAVGSLSGIKYLVIHCHFLLALGTALRLLVSRFSKAWSGYILSRLMPAIDGDYDLIVDYNGQHQTYYMVDKLHASRKAAFFHSDYAKWPYYYSIDKKYFPLLDAIFSISPYCVESLKKFFPGQKEHIKLMENISSLPIIEEMSKQPVDFPKKAKWTFLTIGHLCNEKGTDIAIEAARILREKNIDFEWCFLGNTETELSAYQSAINSANVSHNLRFLGIKTNPYPYIRQADIIVHPSTFEGKSVALDEAKLLCKPIVVTRFSTVNDQFSDGMNASIVDMTPEAVATGIEGLINDETKRTRYAEWLSNNKHDNSSEVEKIYKLLE